MFVFVLYLCCKALDPNDLEQQRRSVKHMESGINTISDWMSDNKLKLNKDKTECMLIGRENNIQKIEMKELKLEEDSIPISEAVRDLGFIVDSHLKMDKHIAQVSKTCYHQIRNVCKIRKFLTVEATKTLIQATVISRLDYCNSLLCGIPKKHIKKLQSIQNFCAWIIIQSSEIWSHLSSVKTPTLVNWIPNKILSLANQAPEYISQMLNYNHPSRALRSEKEEKLVQPTYKLTSCGKKAFSHQAPGIWNAIPLDIRKADSLLSFRKQLKTHYFTLYYC